nr:putative nuclease HARBI1 [Pseudochaenichthys georgianus]
MEDHVQPRPLYCRVNLSIPVLDRFFNDQDTRPDFRLSRESLKVLLELLGQDRRHGWGATIETLVFLFWLASGASCRVVSRVFGMPRSTVHRIVHRVTEEVVAICHQVIHLPRTAEDLEAVSRGFAGLARHRAFRKAAGAIDGCHVRIVPPSGPDGHCYRNRKLFSSILLQAVCDHQGRFIDTYVGWPGHSTLLQGTISSQTGGTPVSNIHSPSSLPTNGRCKVWDPSASTAITPGHAPSSSVPSG